VRYLKDCKNWQVIYADDSAEIITKKFQNKIFK
jgi:hypothetical protein